MESKVAFGLNDQFQPVIKATFVTSEDLRDVVANGFKEAFKHSSTLCSAIFEGNTLIITPIPPEETGNQLIK